MLRWKKGLTEVACESTREQARQVSVGPNRMLDQGKKSQATYGCSG